MSAQHTPGPWTIGIPNVSEFSDSGIHGGDWIIADICGDVPDEPMQAANARLIAAAPDLLNALSVLADAAEEIGIPCDAARAALAKATGEGA